MPIRIGLKMVRSEMESLFIYLFKSDSQSITEKKQKNKKAKTTHNEIHIQKNNTLKEKKKLPRIYCK